MWINAKTKIYSPKAFTFRRGEVVAGESEDFYFSQRCSVWLPHPKHPFPRTKGICILIVILKLSLSALSLPWKQPFKTRTGPEVGAPGTSQRVLGLELGGRCTGREKDLFCMQKPPSPLCLFSLCCYFFSPLWRQVTYKYLRYRTIYHSLTFYSNENIQHSSDQMEGTLQFGTYKKW